MCTPELELSWFRSLTCLCVTNSHPQARNQDGGFGGFLRTPLFANPLPGMPNLRKNPFSTNCYHLFQSTDKQMIYGRIYGVFLNPRKQVTKCCKMFTILADSFPSVLDEHERGTYCMKN